MSICSTVLQSSGAVSMQVDVGMGAGVRFVAVGGSTIVYAAIRAV